ncbi:MAG: hypothetical protein K5785_00050 [Nitrosarchaeum sp.]|nr:hypothetical protein [Nitrosarchaeum sp.]
MTICVGAISKNSNAAEQYALVASDRMVTLSLPSIEWEQNVSKTLPISDNCVAATAGSAIAFTEILRNAKPKINGLKKKNIAEIVDIIRQEYNEARLKKIEEDILSKIGLTLKTFYEGNQVISPQIVQTVMDAMAKFNYGLSILIAGVDDSGAHIYRIDNPARADCFDSIGYCAIGSGDLHALTTFIANDYDPNLDLNHVCAMTYESKKRSEKAQGVGEKSDLYIICDSRVVKMPSDAIEKLDSIYLMRAEQEKKVVADIQNEIEKLDIEKIEKNGRV